MNLIDKHHQRRVMDWDYSTVFCITAVCIVESRIFIQCVICLLLLPSYSELWSLLGFYKIGAMVAQRHNKLLVSCSSNVPLWLSCIRTLKFSGRGAAYRPTWPQLMDAWKCKGKLPLVSRSRIFFSHVAVTPIDAVFFTNFCFEFFFSEIVSSLFYVVCLEVNRAWLNS